MIRVNQIKCPVEHTREQLFWALCRKLKCREKDILEWKIKKRSVDARKKPKLYFIYTLTVLCREEERLLKRLAGDKDIGKEERLPFCFQATGDRTLSHPPVIVGTGPAGLFCGYELARAGYRPILLERGCDVETRSADVERFWKEGVLRENSNIQFGEGGAGTFSDGKLNTLVKDSSGRNIRVLETFVRFGAEESILYDYKPHIGTDVLKNVVKRMREEIISLGGEVHFESCVTDIRLEEKDGARRISAVEINHENWLETELMVLAVGHSARDTFFMLLEKKLAMEPKAFAVGFRVQHPQTFINRAQYGCDEVKALGAAPYKLTARAKDGRGVYSFCMCPGGYVVNASSEKGRLAVNGMSYSDRGGTCANSAIIVSVSPEDYEKEGFMDEESGSASEKTPLAGIAFQRELEKRAYEAAEGKVPVQKYGSYKETLFRQGVLSEEVFQKQSSVPSDYDGEEADNALKAFTPAIKGQYQEADITGILPSVLNKAFVEGMEQMDRQIHGFASDEVWLCGIESRTSSPVRILRDEKLEGNIRGIYPCGEGAGYAGGITSAAMDGIKIAQQIASIYNPF